MCEGYHNQTLQTGWVKQHACISSHFWNRSLRPKPARPSEASLLGLRGLPFALALWPLLSAPAPFSPRPGVLTASVHWGICQVRLEPTVIFSLKRNYLFKNPISKYTRILIYWRLELQHMILGGRAQFNPYTYIKSPGCVPHTSSAFSLVSILLPLRIFV